MRYFYVQHHWQRNVEAEARARLQALQARIHPHFLFNAPQHHRQPDPRPARARAEQAVLDLADMLRSALAYQERITLGEELELTRRYLAIERLRLGERLRVDWQLDERLAARPADSPLCCCNRWSRTPSSTASSGCRQAGDLDHPHRTTTDTPDESPPPIHARPTAANATPTGPAHRAQHNIRQRLQLAYSAPSPLQINETPEHYQISFTSTLDDRQVSHGPLDQVWHFIC
ncbi:MAG: histidine kinase [Comamonadaceae bacterium]|nr:histidine kinase [Comamonadaceae bacterium]